MKKIKKFKNNKEIESFVDKADLSQYDLSDFKTASFEFAPKSKSISLRLSPQLYEAIKTMARKKGLKVQQLIRQALEKAV